MNWYNRFCCAVHYFFEHTMENEDAEIFTFFFMHILIQLNIYSVICVIGIFFREKTVLLNRYDQAILFIIICIVNYLVSFRRLRYLNYEDRKLSGWVTCIIILLTCLAFAGITFSYRKMFFG
jgi:hypothetical protein